ncbi:hypothetical protein CSC03_1093 [Enterobacter hormaechei]|nr:hypothetical protein CSC03_1093 [Enterobacter hormaechei]
MANKPGFTHLPVCSGNQYLSASVNVLCLLFELIRRLQVETHLNALDDAVTAYGIKACRSHLPATWRTYCMAGVYVFCMIDKREGKL